jgi:outer membrane lipoprotein SlyB
MKFARMLIPILMLAILTPACVATTATSTTWGESAPQGDWVLYGRVENIRQTVHQNHGDPASGAVAGAVIGGVLGTALGGRGFGTFLGATEGAMIGAHTSHGGYAGTTYEVFVRFDDGSLRTFVYQEGLPFRPGDYVVWTPQGLAHR